MSAEPGFSRSVRNTALTFERGPDHGKRTTIVKTLHTGKEDRYCSRNNEPLKKTFFSLRAAATVSVKVDLAGSKEAVLVIVQGQLDCPEGKQEER